MIPRLSLHGLAFAAALALAVTIGPDHPSHGIAWSRTKPATIHAAHVPERVVALSFDDGPDPTWTPRMLDLLAEHHVKATFFVVGDALIAHEAVARAVAADGHELANHTASHAHMHEMDPVELEAELAVTDERIRGLGVEPAALFRFPRGDTHRHHVPVVEAMGLSSVAWTHTLEAYLSRAEGDPKAAAERLAARLRPGSIIVVHDGLGDRSASVAGLDRLLECLDEGGWTAVPVSRLLHLAEGPYA